jgi:imidazolonepropionase-like amidohydrolase
MRSLKFKLLSVCLTIPFAISIGNTQAQTPATTDANSGVAIIRAGTLIDGISPTPLKNQLIYIKNDRITKVSPATDEPPTGFNVIDLSNSTVLPGLIDSHTHIFLWGEDPAKGGYDANILKAGIALRAARATFACRRALEQGFTTLRDLETEGAGYGDVEIKEAIAEGTIPGPRLFCATRGISSTGGYNLEGYAPELDMPKGVQIIDGPIESRKAARQQLEHGADWIKVYMTHRSWVDKQGHLISQPTLTAEELKAIVDEVHGWGKKVACHAYSGVGLQRALDGGCDSIEHGLDRAPEDTPAGKRDRARAAAHEVSFKKALQAHLKIIFGTDIGGMPWSESIAREFPRMVSLGMSPMDAIQAATSRPAEMLEMKGEIGVVAPGAYADIIAVNGDPLKDISILEHVPFVMHNGSVYKNEAPR